MQLKNTLVGGLIGGAIGLAVLIAAYFLFGTEHTAVAIVVALLVGLGVRAMVVTKGHPSYARGALTALIAMATFLGGKYIVVEIATRQVASNSIRLAATPTAPPKLDDLSALDSGDSVVPDEQTEVEVTRESLSPAAVAIHRPPLSSGFSIWDFLWVFVAALVAYELGRGTGLSPVVVPAPAATSA